MDLNYFVFNGIKSADYKAYIADDDAVVVPEEEYEMIQIPGRNGDLAISKDRYQNINVSYDVTIFADNEDDFYINFYGLIDAIKASKSYQRLESSRRPDEYRMAIFKDAITVAPEFDGSIGEFTLTFNCKPQRYLVSGEIPRSFELNVNWMNPTPFDARPLIKVTGYGSVTIGQTVVTITGTSDQVIYIDCDLMEAYEYSGSAIITANSKISLSGHDFPALKGGESTFITRSYATISELKITPRWWRL